MHVSQVCEVFHQCFAGAHRTRLEGGAPEPLFQPALNESDCHKIIFREDYVSSALHEISHWCIAGKARRQLTDFGYWYEGERCGSKQREFEVCEARPQGLEWILSAACGTSFRVSCDNFDDGILQLDRFRAEVQLSALNWIQQGLPLRARHFAEALVNRSGQVNALDEFNYRELPR